MTRARTLPVDVSAELASLQYDAGKQNKALSKLPANHTIERRPINHAPIASLFAGPKAQKVVYISRKTPVLSAVKRVKKFLREIEKRALQSQGVAGVLLEKSGGRNSRGGGRDGSDALQRRLEDVSDKLRQDAEEVLVRASGRAMEQALRIAEWFRNKEDEMMTTVEVRTGSISVVDDIVEKDDDDGGVEVNGDDEKESIGEATTELEGGDTTMELLGGIDRAQGRCGDRDKQKDTQEDDIVRNNTGETVKRRRKRRRKEYDPEDVPEARLRWVKTIEIAISLRG